jgi:hypothetical protein
MKRGAEEREGTLEREGEPRAREQRTSIERIAKLRIKSEKTDA